MPGSTPPPTLINRDPTKVGYDFLGAAPGQAGLAGIVAERVGHVHPIGRTIRQTAGMGLYQDINATSDNCNAYLTTNVGALPALGAWTFETWFYGGNGVVGGAEIGWFLGFFPQGNAVSTPNPNGGASVFPAPGFVNQGGGGGGAQFRAHDGTQITLPGVTSSWNHLALVWDGVAYHAYSNGALAGSYTPATAPSLAALLLGLGAWQTGTFTGRIRVAQTRLSSLVRYTAPFTPAQVPFIPDANTVGLWNYSDVPLGNWGVFYQTGGSSPAPGGQQLAAGWHWTPSVAFDASGNGRDLGLALFLQTNIGDHGSCIYSAGVAGITAADAVVASPAVTSLQAMTGDVQLQDSTGAALAPVPGTPGVVKLPVIPALDATAGDIQPVAGAAAAGSVGKAADAGHQHVGVHSVTAGTNVTLGGTATDPVINASGGGGGGGGSGPGVPLAIVKYDPGSIATKNPGTSLAAVDSTNLTVSFTVPASGIVMVVLTGNARGSSNNNGDWMGWGLVTHGTTTLVSDLVDVLQQVSQPGGGVQVQANVSARLYISGLTPGAAVQWDWAYQTSGTGAAQAAMIVGNNGTIYSPALIEVYDGTIGDQSWTPVTYQNSWQDFGGGFAGAAFRKDALGFVHLRGVIKSGTPPSIAFTLPTGYRPLSTNTFPVTDGGGAVGAAQVASTGTVTISGTGLGSACTLGSITFLGEQ